MPAELPRGARSGVVAGGRTPAEEGAIVRDAFAKVNVRLRVFPPDVTGFHPLETLLLRADLRDRVEVRRRGAGASGIRLSVEWDGPADPLPQASENLAWRAAAAFFQATRLPAAADIHLLKRIPAGAGLGGGSADAAATLRALNRMHGEPLEDRELLELAGGLGSDVPFALQTAAAALAWERGRRLIPLPAPPPLPALVVVPPFRVATGAAYGWLAPEPGPAVALPPAERLADWSALAALSRNDFEEPVLARHPALAEALRRLRDSSPILALLAGSGSALFSVHADEAGRDRAASALEPLRQEGWRTLSTRIPPRRAVIGEQP